jgi:hypothetical protein
MPPVNSLESNLYPKGLPATMLTFTNNLNLQMPGTADRHWDVPLNANTVALDQQAALGTLAVSLTEVPSASLNVKVSAGIYRKGDGTLLSYPGTSARALTANALNYIYLTDSGVLTVNTTGWPTGNIVALATVLAGASTITTINDQRSPWTAKGGHLHLGVGSPTIAASPGAGTSPTVSLVNGSDQAGLITLTTGTSPAASSVVATLTFGLTFFLVPRSVILTPANAATSALSGAGQVWANSAGVTTTQFTLNSGTTPLAASTAYAWWYQVMG